MNFTTSKKIMLIALAVLVAAGLAFGGYKLLGNKTTDEKSSLAVQDTEQVLDAELLGLEGLDISDSPIPSLSIPEIELNILGGLGSWIIETPDLSLGSSVSVETPSASLDLSDTVIDIDMGSMSGPPPAPPATPPSAPPSGPDAATCAQFDSAPSCSYVPANVRDLCEQCKVQ